MTLLMYIELAGRFYTALSHDKNSSQTRHQFAADSSHMPSQDFIILIFTSKNLFAELQNKNNNGTNVSKEGSFIPAFGMFRL